MNLQLEKSEKYLNDIKILYEAAFPDDERADFKFLLNGRYPNYELFAITKENVFLGFIFVTKFKNIAYVVYFAIKKEFRNCGYGSLALSLLKEKFKDCAIMLSIEKPASEIQKRRLRFYQKNNFVVTGFELKSNNVNFQVLCCGKYNVELLTEFFKLNFPNAEY